MPGEHAPPTDPSPRGSGGAGRSRRSGWCSSSTPSSRPSSADVPSPSRVGGCSMHLGFAVVYCSASPLASTRGRGSRSMLAARPGAPGAGHRARGHRVHALPRRPLGAELPAPWWPVDHAGVGRCCPLLSLLAGRRLPRLLLPHGLADHRRRWCCCGSSPSASSCAPTRRRGAARPGRRARARGPRRARRARPLADRAVGQGRARVAADRHRPGPRQGRAGVDPGHRPPGARRGPGHGRRPAGRQPRGRADRSAAACSPTPASRRRWWATSPTPTRATGR